MNILGIDPGLTQTGYGIIQVTGTQTTMVDYGIIKPNAKETLPQRLITIFNDVAEIIEKYTPSVMAIEDIFYGKNIRSTLMLGHARGAALLAAAQQKIPIYEYSPRKVKQALTGNGNAHKQQVQFMVKSVLQLADIPQPQDASDALALCLCHTQQFRQGDI
ncbi:MAG: crossover junction endodeoxyribonuclease RuvC [Candidatus Marinimicrobia bacterium]|nr:crossover junction endodeoxyribonuclease RuvC [Candidatus Neomarinimicrobiota bacterium]